jgi:hypothetical protein
MRFRLGGREHDDYFGFLFLCTHPHCKKKGDFFGMDWVKNHEERLVRN